MLSLCRVQVQECPAGVGETNIAETRLCSDNPVVEGLEPTAQNTKNCVLESGSYSHTATTNETDFHAAQLGSGRLARVATSASADSGAQRIHVKRPSAQQMSFVKCRLSDVCCQYF